MKMEKHHIYFSLKIIFFRRLFATSSTATLIFKNWALLPLSGNSGNFETPKGALKRNKPFLNMS
jgi:hypothetical protein